MNHEYYPLSLSQWNILNQELKFDNTPINNICTTLNIYGRVDFIMLQETINYIIEHDESLRLRFKENETVKQYINPYVPLELPIFDFTLTNKESIDKWIEAISKELMPLFDQDMFQFYLFKSEECQGGVLIKTHHLISDGYTQVLLCNRIAELYLKKLYDQKLPDLTTFSYQQHIAKQQAYLNSEHYQKDQAYWQHTTSKMKKAVSIKEHKSAALTYAGNRLTCELDERLNHLIYQYCLEKRISPFSLFYMALAIWLKRAFNTDESTIGVPILNRNDHQEKNTSGMFVSTLPFYSEIDENWTINEFNQHLMIDWLELLKHQKYPFNDIYQLAKKNDPLRQELFHIVLSYQNSLAYQFDSTQVYFDGRWNYSGYQAQDLCIHISHRLDQQRYTIDYDYLVQLFSKDEIIKLHEMLMIIIEDALTYQNKPIYSLNYLSDDMINKVLYRFSSPYQDYLSLNPLKATLSELAKKTPNKVALIADGHRMTYASLYNEALSRIHYLDKADGPIVLIMHRGFGLLVMMIACILCGKTFIIVDVNTPIKRIMEIIDNAQAKLAITERPLSLTITTLEYAKLEPNDNQLDNHEDENDIVYIVYTSGTTGKPKGVRIKQKSIMNFARCSARLYGHQAVLSICNVSFDAFILETLVSLINYQTIVLADDSQLNNANYLSQLINDHAVGFMAMTPSRLLAYMQSPVFVNILPRMETIICGGELFPSQLLQKLKQHTNAKIINQYGPSEATIGVSYQVLNDAKMISVGKPMVGCKIYVLDDHLLPLPIGAIGEVYIAGLCLADGYQNDKDQTNDLFIINPFAQNELMYRTKDNGYWSKDGELIITGRSDLQVKYHGYRIELQEIASRLNQHSDITDATVILDIIKDKQLLIGYYVSDRILTNSELRTFLAPFLPYYMLPQYFIRIDAVPLSTNGKVDQNLLPKLQIEYSQQLPETELESQLLAIFKDNLHCEDLFIDSDYFLNGGDSLSALELLSMIELRLGFRLSIMDLYTLRNIKDIASQLLKQNPPLAKEQAPKNNDDHYLMTPIQRNIYFMQMLNQNCAYNMPGYIKLNANIDRERLEKALNQILANEPVLRSSFMIKDDQLIARINDCTIHIAKIDATDKDMAIANFVKPFALDQAPLIRVSYYINGTETYLLIDMHHIIMDGVSTSLFVERLIKAYNGSLDKPEYDYRDHASSIKDLDLSEQKQRWLTRLDKLAQPFKPEHNPYATRLDSCCRRLNLAIDDEIFNGIEATSKQLKITNFSVMVAAFSYLMHKFGKQDLVSIGTVTSGRNKPYLNDMLGVFINTLPLITDFKKIKTIADLLMATSHDMMAMLADQDITIDVLLESLRKQNNAHSDPLYNVTLSYRPFTSTKFMLDDQELQLVSVINKDPKMDLSIDIYHDDGKHFVQYDFDQAIFSDELIRFYHNVYLNILKAFSSNHKLKLAEIEPLSYQQRFEYANNYNQFTPYPYLPLDRLIDQQSQLSPNKTAIIFNDEPMSYQQFKAKTDQLAVNLIASGLKNNDAVAIALKRGFELLIAMVAINKAGGCYVPLDLDFPSLRLEYMIKDSGCKFLIKDGDDHGLSKGLVMIDLHELKELTFAPINRNNMNDDMYILYTSGSTGQPKGVVLPYRALSNLNQALNFVYDRKETVLCSTNPVFDVFITESLLALAHGKTVIMCNDDQLLYPWQMAKLIDEYQIDLVQFTPTRCNFNVDNKEFDEALAKVKAMILVGEPMTINLMQKLQTHRDLDIYNFYGPTEAAVYVSYKNLKNEDDVTIGKPLANCRLYVLDDDHKLAAPTISGELYLAGECLAKGYINKPVLTEEAFVTDILYPNEKMYKTGDICYQELNGDIVYQRRKDQQIKLDGHRIEIEEINAALLTHAKIKQAHTIAIKQDDKVTHLESYVIADCTQEELKAHLLKSLPSYMVPSMINIVDVIPLTASGKADLKNMKITPSAPKVVTNTTSDLRSLVLSAWQKVLDTSDIDENLSFFEQGGTSLKALMLINAYYEMNKMMTMKEFYQYPRFNEQLALLTKESIDTSDKDKQQYRFNTPNASKPIFSPNILLTGASGFLGSHILYELCQQDRKIYCIVRDKKRFINAIDHYFTHEWYMANQDKIIIVTGDILIEQLNLSPLMYQYLIDNVKEIIHCAANVNHYGDEQAIFDVNVKGTENIIKLAKEANASLHHVSTTAIFGDQLAQHGKVDQFDEQLFDVGQNWKDNAYTKSKFLAEAQVYNAIDEGLRAHVYRVDHLIDRQNDNIFQLNPDNNELYRIFKGLNELNALPDLLADQIVYLTPVDDCAKALIAAMYSDQTTYHLFNPYPIQIKDCLPNLKIITSSDYQAMIKTTAPNNSTYIPDATAALIRQSKVQKSYPIKCDMTVQALAKQGFSWPTIRIDRIFK